MARVGKAIRRSFRVAQRLSSRTADRIETAQAAFEAGSYDANQLVRDVAGQTFDVLGSWLDLMRAVPESPPSAFIDLKVSGRGTSRVSGAATVTLDESIADIGLLQKTELCNPTGRIRADKVLIKNLGNGPQVEGLKISVTVPNNQKQGLYQGFITTGPTVQVDVRVSVHT